MPTIRIHNAETGEVINREMNEEEIERFEYLQSKGQEEAFARKELLLKKQQLLDKLGITQEEANLLLE